MIKCDCGNTLKEKDIGIIDTAPVEYYPYEGEVYTFYCPVCGYISTFKEDDIKEGDL
jgi:hypothetical protein